METRLGELETNLCFGAISMLASDRSLLGLEQAGHSRAQSSWEVAATPPALFPAPDRFKVFRTCHSLLMTRKAVSRFYERQ